MNDELDALRSFRPEATGPTDALQLHERTALMETIAHAPTGAPRRKSRLRPRRRILLVVAVALVTAVGAAGATGIIPDDVQQALGLVAAHSPDGALVPVLDEAVQRTSVPTADGGTLELWTAPTNGGGSCAYLRQLDAAGAPTDSGPINCRVTLAGGGRMGETMGQATSPQGGGTAATSTMMLGGPFGDGRVNAQLEVDATGAATLFGQAPAGVAKVEVVDSGGTALAEATATDGWFLLALPADTAPTAVSLAGQSASGVTVGSLAIEATPPPVPPTASGDSGAQSSTGTAPA